jgi:putative spermidine/putrescine transport system substrate-binding protein
VTRPTLSRRQFLASALATAGCGRSAPTGEHRGRSLTVFVYSGLDKIFETHFVAPFREKTGANVTLDAGWWDAIGKLKASPKGEPAYDLVLTDATQGYPAIKGGMFRQLDFNRIPNHKALAPVALDNWVAKDRYGVTFHESAMTLGYDPKQTKLDPPTTWGDLMRDDLRGKLSLYNTFYFSLYTFACMKAAAEGKPGHASKLINDDIGSVLTFARKERERVRFWWPSGPKMLQDLTQGNFAAGNGHSVTFLQAIKENPGVGFITPAADRAFVQLMWVVPADSPNAELAEEAIDFLLRQDVQAAVARAGMGTSHAAAAEEVANTDHLWSRTYPHTTLDFQQMRYFPYEAYFKDWDGVTKAWENEVLKTA